MLLSLLIWCFILFGISFGADHSDEILRGPSSPSDWQRWIKNITELRQNDTKTIHYNGSIFDVIPLQWTQTSFIQPQMHGYDAYFYDANTHSYTYDKWINDLVTRYGGIDSFLFWVTYTNIGADNRNQFEMNMAIPGGLQALRDMISHMHEKYDIKVLFPYNPWDTGTHYSGNEDYITMAQFLNETGGDGFNGDTMATVPEQFYTYSVNTYGHHIAIEPEGGGSLQSLNWDTMGWGYWHEIPYTFEPFAGHWKYDDARHMTNICNRWAKNRTDDIQNAFFNGIGYESWENVWGCFNKIVPRDGEAIRRVGTMLRFFGNRYHNPKQQNFTQSLDWLPFIPVITQKEYQNAVFASMFPVNFNTNKQQIVFLIINRGIDDINELQITLNNTFTIATTQLTAYDCYHGKSIPIQSSSETLTVSIDIEGIGFGAVLIGYDTRQNNDALDSFLNTMSEMTSNPLRTYSTEWKYLKQTMTPIAQTKQYSTPPDKNSITIPRGIFYLNNSGVEIEGSDATGVDVQFPFEMQPQREHYQYMTIPKIYVDKYPITCSEYESYLTQSGYKPTDTYNYLKNWNYSQTTGQYMYPNGYGNKPVTYLGLSEARAYCQFVGKRLPHSYEWLYAAQGNTSHLYPWGNKQNMGINFPQSQDGRELPGPADVDAYTPKGNSMFGVGDLIGNIWQYTDEFTDEHTRAVIVHGSANYRPTGSKWYFPVAYQLNQHNKYFLMDDSYERCGTIGFRCVADAVQPHGDNTNDIFNWNGKGYYCSDGTIGNEINNIGPLCGMINPQNGYNDLTNVGNADWVQFGVNSNDQKSGFQMIRKDNMIYGQQFIKNISCSEQPHNYSNNPNAFYWSDGGKDIPVLSIDDASINGVWTAGKGDAFSFEIDGLEGGDVYRLRIYVGVYQGSGIFEAELDIGSSKYQFVDSSIDNGDIDQMTSNIIYDLILNLGSVSVNQEIKLMIKWLYKNGKNITLQAIALSQL